MSPRDAMEPGRTALELRIVAERRHNGGLIVRVYEMGRSGTFTFNLGPEAGQGGLSMFGSADEARAAADERLRADGHHCADLGCREWLPPRPGGPRA